ncbi:MAG: MATE family efflux transporter [Thermoanaerobaculia bacterium]|jgi:MATE family multidrug resistance protein
MHAEEDNTQSAGSGDLRQRFAQLTFLNIISNITVPLASMVDTALLGHLESIHFLAGVALAAVIFEYVYWSFGFLRMGTTGITAQAVGRGDTGEVFRTLYRSLLLAWLLAAAILILQTPLKELGFLLLGGEPEVEAAGRAYFDARIWAAPATLSNFVFLGWFLGREESGAALIMTGVANLANVVLDYVFIVQMDLAAFGAGMGTAISQLLMLLAALILFWARVGKVPWVWSDVWQAQALTRLFRLNRDILLRTVALVSAFALFTNFSSLMSTVVLAANAVLLRWVMLAAYLIDGAAFATESLAGILFGTGDRVALRRLQGLALRSGVAFALPFCALALMRPAAPIRLLTSHPQTVETALQYLPWLAPVLFFGSLAYIYDGLFLGLTAGRALRNAMLLSTFGVFLPLAALALHLENSHLLWASMAAFMMARTATLWKASASFYAPSSPMGQSS